MSSLQNGSGGLRFWRRWRLVRRWGVMWGLTLFRLTLAYPCRSGGRRGGLRGLAKREAKHAVRAEAHVAFWPIPSRIRMSGAGSSGTAGTGWVVGFRISMRFRFSGGVPFLATLGLSVVHVRRGIWVVAPGRGRRSFIGRGCIGLDTWPTDHKSSLLL